MKIKSSFQLTLSKKFLKIKKGMNMNCEWCNSKGELNKLLYFSDVYKANIVCNVCGKCRDGYIKQQIDKLKNKGELK